MSEFNLEDVTFELVIDKPDKGMWHNGPNESWITATHTPTMMSVRAYGRTQHQVRQTALTLLQMMVEDCRWDKCRFPEKVS